MFPSLPAPPAVAATPPSGAPGSSPPPADDGTVTSFDGQWSVQFPSDSEPRLVAGVDSGFGFAQYTATEDTATEGDDQLGVRITEVPAGYEWRTDRIPGDPDADVTTTETTVGGLPAFRATYERDG